MKTKIAVIVSGAVSLGSYEAGVLYELFYALQKLGKDANFKIDVITGASAGSINSAILAASMIYDPALIKYLEQIWIEGLDIISLLEDIKEPEKSIFSKKAINDLKTEFLNSIKEANNPLPYAPDSVKVAFTLTNLTGIPYEIRYSNKKDIYKSTTFADWYVFSLEKGKKNINDMEIMLDMATASGSFPFAFPAMKLKRKWQDYKATAVEKPSSGELEFIYVDGGVFNNEPINRARRLADELGKSDEPQERIYLLVDPTPPQPAPEFEGMTMLDVAKRLVPAIFTEAHFRDWYDASKVNQRLEWEEEAINRFIRFFGSPLHNQSVLEKRDYLKSLAHDIASFKAEREGKTPEAYLAKNKDRIAERIAKKFQEETQNKLMKLEDRTRVQDFMVDFVFVLECVSGLRDKKILDIRLLSPEKEGDLAGDFLINFGAFFSKDYRIHDFKMGREVTRKFLTESKAKEDLEIDLSKYNPEEYKPDRPLGKVTIKNVPSEQKLRLKDSLVERIGSFVENWLKVNRIADFWGRIVIPLALMFWPWRKLLPWMMRKLTAKVLDSVLEIE
ncbi:MAG: hypothetical protein AMJ78_04875 [Omnitrophica WOR_2 bacterium SM23_29]|nr:MAG: hypothetical protein AMJ78_04875 [Omnitrophica WOR_2 bacterium SM23_29]